MSFFSRYAMPRITLQEHNGKKRKTAAKPYRVEDPEAGPSSETQAQGHRTANEQHLKNQEAEENEEVSSEEEEDEKTPLLPRGKSHTHVMANRIGQKYNALQQNNLKRQKAAHVNIDLSSDSDIN